ncbi:MAG: CGNR zinc finger domain-containing protein [bacterium]|nr:CGNR zinc finger domain-containing protein [bacterium]
MAAKDPSPGQLETLRDFLNTIDLASGSDDFGSPEALRDWLAERKLIDGDAAVEEPDVARAIEVREAFRDVVFANTCKEQPDAAALAVLSAVGAEGSYRMIFHPQEGPTIEPVAGGLRGALAALVAIMAQAMLDGSWGRFKACRRDDCRWAFFDWTKNHSGLWCSMAGCGNLMKARRYQERKRGKRGGER